MIMDLKDKYKTLFVIHSCSLRDFMNDHRLEIAPTDAFFQLNRPVTVDNYRDVIARKRSNGSFLLKAEFVPIVGSAEFDDLPLSSVHLADYDVFVQCSNYNQLLNGGTEFLYQEKEDKMEDSESTSTDVNENGVPSSNASPIKVPTRLVGPPGSDGNDLVICFDTTGSMGACIAEVSKQAPDVFRNLFDVYPNLRISPFAHGDYIDRFKYVTTFINFTQNHYSIKEWMDGVETTYGGDWEECYELALHEIRTQLSWRPNTKRSLIMIGDAIPHEPHVSEAKLDWEAELEALVNDLGVRVYAVQCGSNALAKDFWEALAFRSGGKHLSLDNFPDAADMITAICHREHNIDKVLEFANEVRQRDKAKGLTDPKENLFAIFDQLSIPDDPPSALKEDSVVGKTVDFTHVKRRLLEIEEAKKVEAEKAAKSEAAAMKERDENDALDSEKDKEANDSSKKGSIAKKISDKPKKVVNRKRKADMDEKSPPKKKANQALDGQRKKLVSKSKKLVSEKIKAAVKKKTPVKKASEKSAVQAEKKTKKVVKPAKAVKKTTPVVKKAAVKKVVTKKPLKMSKEKIVKTALDAKKKAILKKITPKKMTVTKTLKKTPKKEEKQTAKKTIKKTPKNDGKETAKKILKKAPKKEEKAKNAKKTPLKKIVKKSVEKKQVKKNENSKKAPKKVDKKPVENAKKTKPAVKTKTVEAKPVKKAAPKKKEDQISKTKASKNVIKTPPLVTTVSTSKRRAAQNASCVWESLTKSPKKTSVSPVVNGKASTKKKPATKKK